jgi:hypothetical protein
MEGVASHRGISLILISNFEVKTDRTQSTISKSVLVRDRQFKSRLPKNQGENLLPKHDVLERLGQLVSKD